MQEPRNPDSANIVDDVVADALRLIDGPGGESLGVKELAVKLIVSRRTLERAFLRNLGHGIRDAILLRRLERAKRLLTDKSLKLKDVALKSGFGNTRNLQRVFVSAMGTSPKVYRNLPSARSAPAKV